MRMILFRNSPLLNIKARLMLNTLPTFVIILLCMGEKSE